MKTLIVYKKSTYELYSNTDDAKLKEYIEENNTDVKEMIRSHNEQKKTLDTVIETMGKDSEIIYRADLTAVTDKDLVISVGGDGTFLEVSHHIKNNIPLLGVNSDTLHSEGHYCICDRFNFNDYIKKIKNRTLTTKELNRLELELNGEIIKEPVLNEAHIVHKIPAAMSRYILEVDGKKEFQYSSGILICSSSGHTGSMHSFGGKPMDVYSKQMQYLVIAPFYGKHFNPTLINGFSDNEIELKSKMRQGMIYIDGSHLRYHFTLGDILKARIGKPLKTYNLE